MNFCANTYNANLPTLNSVADEQILVAALNSALFFWIAVRARINDSNSTDVRLINEWLDGGDYNYSKWESDAIYLEEFEIDELVCAEASLLDDHQIAWTPRKCDSPADTTVCEREVILEVSDAIRGTMNETSYASTSLPVVSEAPRAENTSQSTLLVDGHNQSFAAGLALYNFAFKYSFVLQAVGCLLLTMLATQIIVAVYAMWKLRKRKVNIPLNDVHGSQSGLQSSDDVMSVLFITSDEPVTNVTPNTFIVRG